MAQFLPAGKSVARKARFGSAPSYLHEHLLTKVRTRPMDQNSADTLEVAIFVQLNDFYHIDYSADPTDPATGLLPRIATILGRLRKEFKPHRVVLCLPGDFLNPACLSRTHRSKQMIDLL